VCYNINYTPATTQVYSYIYTSPKRESKLNMAISYKRGATQKELENMIENNGDEYDNGINYVLL